MTTYTRTITMPNTRREGLRNFVQMIVNQIEAGNHEDALMRAVDLCDEFEGSGYSDVIEGQEGKNVRDAIDAALADQAKRHAEAMQRAINDAYEQGKADERKRLVSLLGFS